MAYNARILRDSVSPLGTRLTTLELTFPRIVLAEFNTHRTFSRNSASSRAIPVEKRIAVALSDPFIPETFGKNQKGMQAGEDLTGEADAAAREAWLVACGHAIHSARRLAGLDGVIDGGVHKQLANRVLEPYLWQTVIVTATEWDNWDALRDNEKAQPQIACIARLAKEARSASQPTRLGPDDWHLPLVDDAVELVSNGYTFADIVKVSVGRCARVSYLTHDGRRDPAADVELCNQLLRDGHMSPFEHVARPMTQLDADLIISRSLRHGVMVPDLADPARTFSGNLRGWVQLRKLIPHEDNFKLAEGSDRDLELCLDEDYDL